ncbi:MAG TPA: heavy metal-binding domain-containing protein [Ignavibacteriaceae bacterium]|nr:heavy metal-binding domain-containing protein [Ignavibacteriaceae bacterium]
MSTKMQSRFTVKTNTVKILFLSFVVFLAAASLSLAQDSSKSKSTQHEMKMDKGMKMEHHMNMPAGKKEMDSSMKMGKKENGKEKMKENHSSPVAYKGVINLKSIDDNKDGKIYQCPMDFNVLSDKPGIDPKCGMKLKEVTLKQAKNNLIKYGFKVK